MADFVVKATLIASNEMSAPTKAAADDIGHLVEKTKAVGAASKTVATDTSSLTRAFQQVAIAARAETKALADAERIARSKQQAMRMLGIQLGDFSTQAASGINPAIALGQQIGQMALAAEGFGGKIGAVATFLSGPWGAAIQFGAIVLGQLAAAFFSAKKGADDASKATDLHKMSTRDLIKAIKEQDDALKKALITGQEAEAQQATLARDQLAEIQRRRVITKGLLEEAIARRDIALLSASDQKRGVAAQGVGEVADLKARLAEINKSIEAGEGRLRSAVVPIITRLTDEGLDPAKKAAGDLERALVRLRKEYDKGGESAVEYSRKQRVVKDEYKRTIDAIQAANKTVNNNQTGKLISASEAAAIVRSIGGQVNSSVRTFERQKQLFDAWVAAGRPKDNPVARPGTSAHERGSALDVQFAPGLNPAKLRAAFMEEGVTLTKVFAERGHWHIEWAGGAAQAASAARDMAAAAREAKQADDELNAAARASVDAFDPAAAAAAKYADTIERLTKLQGAGKLSLGQLVDFGRQAGEELRSAEAKITSEAVRNLVGPDFEARFKQTTDELSSDWQRKIDAANEESAKKFQQRYTEAAGIIASLIGGRAGRGIGQAISIAAGDFQNGGRLGAAGRLLTGPAPGEVTDDFTAAMDEMLSPLRRVLDGLGKKISDAFGAQGSLTRAILKGAAMGGVVGPGVTDILGAKGSKLGGQLGGALGQVAGEALKKTITATLGQSLGSAAGPLGAVIGSVIGSLVGGLLKKTKSGSATITNTRSDPVVNASNATYKGSATSFGSSVQDAISQIAQQLGGGLGDFAVSVGLRGNKLKVDPTGQGRTKGAGVVNFGKDELGAVSFAIANAIADGAVVGLSDAVKKALQSSTNIDRALREALKVQDVEDMLSGLGGNVAKALRDFDGQAKERVRIARQYGFDVLKIETINAKERADLIEQLIGSKVGSLKQLLSDLNFGDLFEGSLSEQIKKLQGEASKAQADALAGVDGAADRFAEIQRSLVEKGREAFGTAGGDFANIRNQALTASQQIIAAEEARIKAQQDLAKQTNTLIDEGNDIAAQQLTALQAIAQNTSGTSTVSNSKPAKTAVSSTINNIGRFS